MNDQVVLQDKVNPFHLDRSFVVKIFHIPVRSGDDDLGLGGAERVGHALEVSRGGDP